MGKQRDLYHILKGVIFPVVIGALLYYLIAPDVIFVKKIDDILGLKIHIIVPAENVGYRFLRNYLLDMLWAYALVQALFYILGNNAASLGKAFVIAFSFSTAMEVLQLTTIFKGTFDLGDIMMEFLAEMLAVFIIKIQMQRRKMR
jgi:hypothetical protein